MGFEWAYRSGEPPWDIGRAQPALARLAERGDVTRLRDRRGLRHGRERAVPGLPGARRHRRGRGAHRDRPGARQGLTSEGIRATFLVADALDLAALGRTFDVAFDSGLFHTFADAERPRFERGLRAVIRPGGRYFMLCFSDREPGTEGPRRVSQAEIRGTFSEGWRVDSIVEEHFATRDGPGGSAGRAPGWRP